MKTIRARYIIRSRVAIMPTATGVEIVYRLMATSCPGLTVVNEKREVVGVVTEFDFLGAMREGLELNNIVAEKIMSKNPRTADVDTSAAELIDIMLENNFTIIPIVRKKKFVGIVSRHEIMDAYVDPNFYRYIDEEK
jgi:arabinose-5-phosphate isomerase